MNMDHLFKVYGLPYTTDYYRLEFIKTEYTPCRKVYTHRIELFKCKYFIKRLLTLIKTMTIEL